MIDMRLSKQILNECSEKGFFVFASIFPGAGISVQKITSFETYIPSDIFNFNMDLQVSFGYNSSRMYTTLGFITHHGRTGLDYSNTMTRRLGRIKWVVGFKL